MSESPVLSIIVPVYKVEQYLPRCLDSILTQTFTDFELILIDDGSPDRCGEIMDEYAARDSRIVTIHQPNQGVSAARNTGLKAARGEYVGFVDSDDWIEPDMYEQLVGAMLSQPVDIVCCNVYRDRENGERKINTSERIPELLDRSELFIHICRIPVTINGWSFNKLYKKSLILERFDENIRICEDLEFVSKYCKNVRLACYIEKPLYHYCIRSDSALHRNQAVYTSSLAVRRGLITDIADMGEAVSDAYEDNYLDACLLCCKYTRGAKDVYFYQARRELSSYVCENWRRILKNGRIPPKKKLMIGYWVLRGCLEAGRADEAD